MAPRRTVLIPILLLIAAPAAAQQGSICNPCVDPPIRGPLRVPTEPRSLPFRSMREVGIIRTEDMRKFAEPTAAPRVFSVESLRQWLDRLAAEAEAAPDAGASSMEPPDQTAAEDSAAAAADTQ